MGIDLDRYIILGKVGSPYGLEGAVKIISFTENSDDIFTYSPWYIKQQDRWVEFFFEAPAIHGNYLVAKLTGCDDRNKAQQWTNREIAVKRSQLPTLEAGQHYWSDLEGMTVKTVHGIVLGVIDEVMETGANPVLVVEGKNRYLVPYVLPNIVKEVNIDLGELIVEWDTDY